ncbi:MAG: hypothetical protein IKU81_05685 [Oscillibacter sp.]|nr:hypothetical protein [Oscillibacter sp.]
MSDNRVWDIGILLEDKTFDYVEYSVNSWREWICRAMDEVEKTEVKEIKLLTYFSIIEMMAQEYYDFPTKSLQGTFTKFVLEFQNRYDFLELTDPITLYYREEDMVSATVGLADLEDGGIYYPKSDIIRKKTDTLKEIITEAKGEEYANKKATEHRYIDLLYRVRCRLSHEFSAPHMSLKQNAHEPYYINCSRQYVTKTGIVSDEVWKLLFPTCFIKELCLNCFDNYLEYCLRNHVPPNRHNGMDRFCELSWYSR